ncbi:hypothetical protein Glove_344g73 [Diversispora epigaea]|uniref:Restriction endonuclease type IV Mrr domain-containing protein n=1 Tax=Diversispora epigaea TaxID=1348612 RepID=A0A397HG17_9GLOM|nr:hypothetical protein Glove_344g73 [Diversispora epigaea]
MPPKKRKRTEKEIIIKNYNLDEIIGDVGIDLFGEIVIQNQTLQWIAQCKMTKQLENSTINEMKGLLSSRPNTIGIIIHEGNNFTKIDGFKEYRLDNEKISTRYRQNIPEIS